MNLLRVFRNLFRNPSAASVGLSVVPSVVRSAVPIRANKVEVTVGLRGKDLKDHDSLLEYLRSTVDDIASGMRTVGSREDTAVKVSVFVADNIVDDAEAISEFMKVVADDIVMYSRGEFKWDTK